MNRSAGGLRRAVWRAVFVLALLTIGACQELRAGRGADVGRHCLTRIAPDGESTGEPVMRGPDFSELSATGTSLPHGMLFARVCSGT